MAQNQNQPIFYPNWKELGLPSPIPPQEVKENKNEMEG
jgi:hypothetical protein